MDIAAVNSFFTVADKNHNGILSKKELKKALKSSTTDVQLALSDFLTEKGKIDKANFKAVSGDDKKNTLKELTDYLGVNDEDDDIQLTDDVDELDTNDDINNDDNTNDVNYGELISSIDKNGNGKITKKELKKAYKNAIKTNNEELLDLLEIYLTTNEKGKVKIDKEVFKEVSGGKKYITLEEF